MTNIRCIRCRGRKKIYKVGKIYSYTNTGGVEVNCPMCNGEGNIKNIRDGLKEITEKKENLEVSDAKAKGKTRKRKDTEPGS